MKALKCEFAENKYGTYAVPTSSAYRPAAKKALNGEVWEPETIEFILDNMKPDEILVHAGTYFGDFLPAFRNLYKVYAFEPAHENYHAACVTKEMNCLDNVELCEMGLGSESNAVKFLRTKNPDGTHRGGTSNVVNSETDGDESISIISIDMYREMHGDNFISRVGMVQLDVEGYEEEALKGATRTLKDDKPILILEVWNDKVLKSEFFKNFIFGELGYKVDRELHDNVVLV